MELDDIHSTFDNLLSSIERKLNRRARFPTPELNGQVASQYNPPCMQSLSKLYNVNKMYEAFVMGEVHEIDVMDTVQGWCDEE